MEDNFTPQQKAALISTISKNDIAHFNSIINMFPKILNTQLNDDGSTALHLASRYARTEIVRSILSHNEIQIDARDKKGRTALHYSISENYDNITELLLRHHAKPEIKDSDGIGAYFYIKNISTIDVFLNLGFSPDYIVNNVTALLYFSRNSKLNDLSKYLLEHNANPDFYISVRNINSDFNFDVRTPLSIALESGNLELVKYLLANYADKINFSRTIKIDDPLYREFTYTGSTYLHCAARYGYPEIIELLYKNYINDIDVKADHGITPLMLSVRFGEYDSMLKLIELGANIYALTNSYETVLHYAALYNYDKKYECITYLVNKGLDVNANAYDKHIAGTPLTYAIRYTKSVQLVDLLIKHLGAEVTRLDLGLAILHYSDNENITKSVISSAGEKLLNSKDEDGQTPIFGIDNFDSAIMKMMIEKGADPTVRDNNGNDVLSYLMSKRSEQKALDLLKCAGKRILKAESNEFCSYLVMAIRLNLIRLVERLIALGANVNKVSPTKSPLLALLPIETECPFEAALRTNNIDAVKLLIKAKVNKNITIATTTILNYVCCCNKSLPMLKLLVEDYHYDINQVDCKGNSTAFSIACLGLPEEIDENSIVGYLLLNNLNINIFNNRKYNPLINYICKNTDMNSVRLFCKHYEFLMNLIKYSNGEGPLLKTAILLAMISHDYDEKFIINCINSHPEIDVMNYRNILGKSALHFAIESGKIELAKMLLDKGIQFNDLNDDGRTKARGSVSSFAYAVDYNRFDLVKMMLEKNPLSINDTVEDNLILKHTLANGNFEMFKFLIDNSTPEASGIKGEIGRCLVLYAKECAQQASHKEITCEYNNIIKFLIEHGAPNN